MTTKPVDMDTAPQVRQMYVRRFSVGTPRSDAYKAGYLAQVRHKLEGQRFVVPYKEGTAQADAFLSGAEDARLDMSSGQ